MALYARVSSNRQDVDLSVNAQLRALRDYNKSNGYSVAREYVDEAESGRIVDRLQFRKMIEEGGGNNVRFQVILSPTCLSRTDQGRRGTRDGSPEY